MFLHVKLQHEFLTICVSQRKYRTNGGHRLVNIDAGNYTFKIAAVSLAGNGSYTPLMYFVIPPKVGELCLGEEWRKEVGW